MTEFGPAPINTPCPDCGVYPLDGYMSHLTTCPSRSMNGPIEEKGTLPLGRNSMEDSIFPMPEMDYGLRKGKAPPKGPSRWQRLLDWLRWHWRQINWDAFWLAVLFALFACLVVWFGLEWLEGASK